MGSAKWWGVTDWYVDPAQTHGGSDENSGLTSSAPLKSIAEWRRRVKGADYSSNVVIHVLSSSTNADDGIFYGVTTQGSTPNVVLVGTTTVLFSGTLTAYQAYSGNTRGSVTDSALTSWTASDGISTTTASRYIRSSGGGKQAPLLKDMGSKTAMIGIPITASETDTTNFPSATATDFTNGDAYEVVSRFRWPQIFSIGCKVRVQCLDVKHPSGTIGSTSFVQRDSFVLCGVLSQSNYGPQLQLAIGCVYLADVVATASSFLSESCAYVSCTLQIGEGSVNWNTLDNVFVTAPLQVFHHGALASSGTLRCFDNVTACLAVQHGSRVNLQSLLGSGNTGKLISCGSASGGNDTVSGGSFASATTTDANPYALSGVSSASSPGLDINTGNAIYAA